MAQLFPRGSNAFARISIVVVLVVVGTGLTILLNTNRLHYTTDVQVARKQPVPFSHKHHVTGVGLDCRYCHTSVEESSFANIPPVETCMTCHSQIWTESPLLEPIRESYRTGNPIEWVRIHDLPRFCLFQSQHSRPQRHRMSNMSRAGRSNAPDVESEHPQYGMVSGMSPGTREICASPRRSFQYGLDTNG